MSELHVNDLMVIALVKEGYAMPSLNDSLVAWLQAEVGLGASDNISDLWTEYLDVKLVPPGHRDDRLKSYLTSLGHTQEALADQKYSWWEARATA